MYACTFKERQMNRCCNKTVVFKHCDIDSGFSMNKIHLVEFVLKSEESPLLCQILSKMEFTLSNKLFSCFPKTG